MENVKQIIAMLLVAIVFYICGRGSVWTPEIGLRYGKVHNTVEMYKDGELVYELEEEDGVLYFELKKLLLPP